MAVDENPMYELILTEVRALREEVNTSIRETGERLATLDAGMYDLRGNGQPGRVSRLEKTVEELSQWKNWVLGIAAGISAVASTLVCIFIEFIKH